MKYCIKPRLVLNPALPEYCMLFEEFHTPNGCFPTPKNHGKFDFPYHYFKSIMYSCSDPNEYYFKDNVTHLLYPLFIEVGCGECVCCQNSRQNDLVQRMRFQDKICPNLPLFVTLTYNNKNLPKDRKLSKKHFQNFLKRLRHQFTFKYFGCGEYGTKHGRPHYHFIIFPDVQKLSIKYFSDIQQCWNFGFIYMSIVGTHPSYAKGDPFGYVAKYSAKDKRGFQLWSKGLGSDFAKSLSYYMYSVKTDLQFTDKYGASHKVLPNNWLLNQVFGSFSRSTYVLRSALYNYMCLCFFEKTFFHKTKIYHVVKDLHLGLDYRFTNKKMYDIGKDLFTIDNIHAKLETIIYQQLSTLEFISLQYNKMARARFVANISFPVVSHEDIVLAEAEARKRKHIKQNLETF